MKVTWFGHSAFRVEFGGVKILIDPFLTGNPSFKGDPKQASAGATHVLLTHGHGDHVGDAVEIATRTGAQVVGSAEICGWMAGQGAKNVNGGNHGGTVECDGFTTSFVNALHSSSFDTAEGRVYLGNPLGLIVKAAGEPALYHMGDTDIFSDMALINEIHAPEVAMVPIGDRYTMGAKTAAIACRRYFNLRTIIPCHYGTFPALDANADKFLAEMAEDFGKVFLPEVGEPFDI